MEKSLTRNREASTIPSTSRPMASAGFAKMPWTKGRVKGTRDPRRVNTPKTTEPISRENSTVRNLPLTRIRPEVYSQLIAAITATVSSSASRPRYSKPFRTLNTRKEITYPWLAAYRLPVTGTVFRTKMPSISAAKPPSSTAPAITVSVSVRSTVNFP